MRNNLYIKIYFKFEKFRFLSIYTLIKNLNKTNMTTLSKFFGISIKNDKFMVDWDVICNNIPEVEKMKTVMQKPDYHAEGDVFAHTKLATEYFIRTNDAIYDFSKMALIAVILHDVGKVLCPIGENGFVKSGGHEKLSAEFTKKLLLTSNIKDIKLDEINSIVTMIKHHDLRYKYKEMKPNKIFAAISDIRDNIKYENRLDIMYSIWAADFYGSIKTVETDEPVEDARRNIWKFFTQVNRPHMILMCGLPGAGKNYFIENILLNKVMNNEEYVVLSRDDIRLELGIVTGVGTSDEEQQVTTVFNERLKTALENRQNIIINNTNLRYQYREMFFNKAKENNYETRLYYINRPYEKLLEARPGDNWKKVIDRMIASFDIPNKNEALIYKEWDEELINYLIKYAAND